MNYIALMAVVDCRQYLFDDFGCILFIEILLFSNLIKQFTTRAQLHDQAAVRPVRREREQPAHVRMSHFAKRRILCFELLGVPVRRALRQPLDCDEEAEDLRPTYR